MGGLIGTISEPEQRDLAPADGLYTAPCLEGIMSDQSTSAHPVFQPLDPSPSNVNFLARLSEKVEVSESGCWLWTGAKHESGYGVVGHRGDMHRVHRVVYALCVAPVPPHLNVCHDCPEGDNPLCCNPSHLFVGTQKENVHDCMMKGRLRARTPPLGESNPQAKLTEDDVRAMRRKAKAGVPLVRLQEEYRLSRAGVSRIVNGRAWVHIKDEEPIETIWGTV